MHWGFSVHLGTLVGLLGLLYCAWVLRLGLWCYEQEGGVACETVMLHMGMFPAAVVLHLDCDVGLWCHVRDCSLTCGIDKTPHIYNPCSHR